MATASPAYIQWLYQQQTIKVCFVVEETPQLYSRSSSTAEVWHHEHVLCCALILFASQVAPMSIWVRAPFADCN